MSSDSITKCISILSVLLVVGCSGPGDDPSGQAANAEATSEVSQTETEGNIFNPAGNEDPENPHPGKALYEENCALCHDKPFYKAPSRMFISGLTPSNILNVMNEGQMMAQASNVDQEGRVAIAEYITGKSIDDEVARVVPPSCDADHQFDPSLTPTSVGWGVDLHNTRFQPEATGGLTAANVKDLEVKWVFAYPNAYQARSEPVYGGGGVYVGSQDGTVWALDSETGCLRWTFQSTAEVRTGVAISPWKATDKDIDPIIYFGDVLANVYAVSAKTGELRWRIRADDHRDATLTGTPTISNGRLYVPVSSLEVVAAANPQYECCTFRGALLSLDAKTGKQFWKSYTTDTPPAVVGKNAVDVNIMAPSGAPVWSSPTVDEKRGFVYVATGENYSSPADGNSDALIAYNLKTGKKIWVSQQTSRDAWNTACYIGFPGLSNINCPEENGPDFDFGSHSILVTLDSGKQVLVGGQKSGDAVGVDPDTGKVLWKTRVGRGGIQGGVHFGIAAEGNTLYVPINDLVFPVDDVRYNYKMDPKPGMYAVNVENGDLLWSALAPDDICGDMKFCDRGISQAVTAIPGAVIAGHLDGRVRIYSRTDGEVLWEMNMLREYDSVSGEKAKGGAFSGGGVMVSHGQMYINAGYGYNGHIPGNALVVLGLK